MSSTSENNRRILKNTMMLYFRMFLIMGVNFFASRVLLNTLGVDDFGIYNVIGGVTAMLLFVQGVMSAGTTRYLNFALGREDMLLANKTFNVSLTIYLILCIFLIVFGETVGLWFINSKLTIPEDRMLAANWVYQFTLLSAINTMIVTPYNAIIIAHERMNVYAYASILNVFFKLGIVYLLIVLPYDKLIAYGFLYMVCDSINTLIYVVYCKKHYMECCLKRYKDKSFYKEILTYSGWNLFGSLASLVKGQGLNILLNMFFSPAINASRGIAYQVNSAINQFSNNFYTAVRPQITKYYASNDLSNMIYLVIRSSKLLFFLILILSLPIFIEAPVIIDLWLGQLPEKVVVFMRYILAISAVESMALPLMTSVHATGKIAVYQTVVGSIVIANIPISYLLLNNGFAPEAVFATSLVIAVICLFVRLLIVKNVIPEFPLKTFITKVLFKCFVICIVSSIIPLLLYMKLDNTISNAIIIILVSVLTCAISIFVMGLDASERQFVLKIIKKKSFYNENK